MLKIVCVLGVVWWGAPVFADCPPRKGQDEVTLSQVMYQLGRSVRVLGFFDGKSETAPEVIAALEIGVACVDIALTEAEGRLAPLKLKSLEGEDRTEYLVRYRAGLENFRAILLEAKAGVCEAKLDLSRLRELEKLALKAADDSHRDLF